MTELEKFKINLGAGNDIRREYENHDSIALPGIDLIHDLNTYPWPWNNEKADEILAIDILEHLDDFMMAMEELHRVMKTGALVHIKVPYWNSAYSCIDPTHRRGFHEQTFHFFDPKSHWCQERPYYSSARFHVVKLTYSLVLFAPYFTIPKINPIKITKPSIQRIVGFLGNLFSNIICDIYITLQKVGEDN
jgi:hypothetical protein